VTREGLREVGGLVRRGTLTSFAVVLTVGTLGAMSAQKANFGINLNPLHSNHHSPFKDEYGGAKGTTATSCKTLYWLLHQHHY
jgi:hypothetical protein